MRTILIKLLFSLTLLITTAKATHSVAKKQNNLLKKQRTPSYKKYQSKITQKKIEIKTVWSIIIGFSLFAIVILLIIIIEQHRRNPRSRLPNYVVDGMVTGIEEGNIALIEGYFNQWNAERLFEARDKKLLHIALEKNEQAFVLLLGLLQKIKNDRLKVAMIQPEGEVPLLYHPKNNNTTKLEALIKTIKSIEDTNEQLKVLRKKDQLGETCLYYYLKRSTYEGYLQMLRLIEEVENWDLVYELFKSQSNQYKNTLLHRIAAHTNYEQGKDKKIRESITLYTNLFVNLSTEQKIQLLQLKNSSDKTVFEVAKSYHNTTFFKAFSAIQDQLDNSSKDIFDEYEDYENRRANGTLYDVSLSSD